MVEYNIEELLEISKEYTENGSQEYRKILLDSLGYNLPKGRLYANEDKMFSMMNGILRKAWMTERSLDLNNYEDISFKAKMSESFENMLSILEDTFSLVRFTEVTVEIAKVRDFQVQVGDRITKVKEIYYRSEGLIVLANSSTRVTSFEIETKEHTEENQAASIHREASLEVSRAMSAFDNMIEVVEEYDEQFGGTLGVTWKSVLDSARYQREIFKWHTQSILRNTDSSFGQYVADVPSAGMGIFGEKAVVNVKEVVKAGSVFSLRDLTDEELEARGMIRLEKVINKPDGTKESAEVISKIKPNAKKKPNKPSGKKIKPNVPPKKKKKAKKKELTPAEMNAFQLAKIGLKRVNGFTRKDGVVVKEHYRKIQTPKGVTNGKRKK